VYSQSTYYVQYLLAWILSFFLLLLECKTLAQSSPPPPSSSHAEPSAQADRCVKGGDGVPLGKNWMPINNRMCPFSAKDGVFAHAVDHSNI
jgi:hypothetical protein